MPTADEIVKQHNITFEGQTVTEGRVMSRITIDGVTHTVHPELVDDWLRRFHVSQEGEP